MRPFNETVYSIKILSINVIIKIAINNINLFDFKLKQLVIKYIKKHIILAYQFVFGLKNKMLIVLRI